MFEVIGDYLNAFDYYLKSIAIRTSSGYYNGVAETQCALAEMIYRLKSEGNDIRFYLEGIRQNGYKDPMQLLDTIVELPRIKNNMGIQMLLNDTKIKIYEWEKTD